MRILNSAVVSGTRFTRRTSAALLLWAAVAGLGAPALAAPPDAPHAAHAGPAAREGAPLFDNLGSHRHAVTTASKQAQKYFDQGLTLAYAFNHPEAERSFREAARLDPECAMAWWGVALVLGPNINKPMAAEDAPKAWEAIQRARELASKASEAEQAYINALSARYAQTPPKDRAPLDKAYADAMRNLAARFPEDLDAATLFAEALMDTMPWQYWTRDNRPKPETAEIIRVLEQVLARKSDHAGAAHYYIHAMEAVHPEKALAAADALRNLVPGAGHLVHMPAHIYLRLGLYREATIANEAAAAADQSYVSQCNAQGFYPATYYPHNVHFLWYTNAMEGRSQASMEAARTIAEHGQHMALSEAERLRPLYSLVLVRFGKWEEVLKQPRPPEDRRYEAALWLYTQGLALAATGKMEAAQGSLAALQRISGDEKTKSLDTETLPGATLIAIARHDLAGHVALKAGDHRQAIAELRKAVELEDQLPYMEPPYAYMPMRHGLGAALLAAGEAKEAEAVYREDLRRNPNNGWSLFELAQSLRAQGKNDLAEEVTRQFNIAWVRADAKITSSRAQGLD